MKPSPNSPTEPGPLLVFGAHPDDIEFGCGAVIARETAAGRRAHFVVGSLGEAGTHGRPEQRRAEAEQAAALLGATVEFHVFDGDARLEARPAHTVAIASMVRRIRPQIVLAPTLGENQHPDHFRLGQLVRMGVRLARFGGLADLHGQAPHAIGALFFYAVTVEGEPAGATPILIDVSAKGLVEQWRAAMAAHTSQTGAIPYIELQLARAHLNGLRAGVGHAMALYPNDPPVLDSLGPLGRAARSF